MTRRSLAGGVLGSLVLVGGWWLWAAQGVPTRKSLAPPRTARPAAPEGARSAGGVVARNIFEFADARGNLPAVEAKPRAWPSPNTDAAPPMGNVAHEETSIEPPVRLVGVVLRAGHRKAALSIRGELVVLAPGESADGYTVVAIDDENGVRLKGPSGVLTLAPPLGAPEP